MLEPSSDDQTVTRCLKTPAIVRTLVRPAAALSLLVILMTAGCAAVAPSATPSQADERAEDERYVGPLQYARALVQASGHTALRVEVDHLPDAVPTKDALDELGVVLREQTRFRDVTILPPEEIPPTLVASPGRPWTLEEVLAAHAKTYSLGVTPLTQAQNGTLFLHVLYLDSTLRYTYLNQTTTAAGVTPNAPAIVIFCGNPHTLASVGGQDVSLPAGPTVNECPRPTLIHELGHAMGLLNRGAPMVRPHAAPGDPYHSRNGNSVMWGGYDQLESVKNGVQDQMARGSARFDADDLADLAALREAKSS